MGITDNLRTVIVTVVITVALAIMTGASYWAEVRKEPVAACERLSTDQAVATCIAGLEP